MSSLPFGLSPRVHNTLSYSIAAMVLPSFAPLQKPGVLLIVGLWVAHFARRTIESLCVHRYSGRAVPPGEFLIEYLYYWGFSGWIAYGLNAEVWTLPSRPLVALGLVLFVIGEGGNTWAHWKLRALRRDALTSQRSIPQGGLFELVSCPHYLFEITTWLGFALMSQVMGAIAFLALGTCILGYYATLRHRAYRYSFDGREGRQQYPTRRRALVPFIF